MRIAIYARVSTDDKGQDPENQLGSYGNGAQGTRSFTSTLTKRVAGRALMAASSSLPSSKTPTSDGLTVFCSGPWIGSAVKAWCRLSCIYNGLLPTA